MSVDVRAALSGDLEVVTLTETEGDSHVFLGSVPLKLYDFATPGDSIRAAARRTNSTP
jgi:hypothetical protein